MFSWFPKGKKELSHEREEILHKEKAEFIKLKRRNLERSLRELEEILLNDRSDRDPAPRES